ncbi:MAG: hypothetical protein ACRCXM_08835 [Beijerinckiaceae bacterium]
MSDLITYSLPPDWRAKVATLLPHGDMDALDRLIAAGRIVDDDGRPTAELVALVLDGTLKIP